MLSKTVADAPQNWTQAVAQEVIKPVFPQIPKAVRTYLFATCLAVFTGALMFVDNAAMLRLGFSWGLFSLLVVVAAANLWGTRPAVLTLALSAAYGFFVVPRIAPPLFPPTPHPLMLRTLLFIACGTATLVLTHRARRMKKKADTMETWAKTRHAVVMALRETILPTAFANASGYQIAHCYKPLHTDEEVGGDFFDFYALGANRYGLLIGDVMGKGKEAAASIAFLRYSVRALSSVTSCPAALMTQMNHLFEAQGQSCRTTTLFFGVLDTQSGTLSYCSAGHEPPLLQRATGKADLLDSTGPLLGIGLEASYTENTVFLHKDDALLLMTDGITEARNPHGEFLGTEGAGRFLRRALRDVPAQTPQAVLQTIETALRAYTSSVQNDDIALLLLRRTK